MREMIGPSNGRVLRFRNTHPPRVTIVVASLETKNTGTAMKESSGTLQTIIQGQGGSSAVAA
jgi:hypothetical protein